MKKALLLVACFIVGILILVFYTDDKTGKSNVRLVKEMNEPKDLNKTNPIVSVDSSVIEEVENIPTSSPIPQLVRDPDPKIWRPQEPYLPFDEELDDVPVFKEPKPSDRIFDFPEVDPVFPGESYALMMFIVETIEYPEIDKEKGIKGEVMVEFVVEKDGSLSNLRVLSGVTSSIDEEAKRIVRAMPNWKPGENDGEIVRSRMRVPIVFTLM